MMLSANAVESAIFIMFNIVESSNATCTPLESLC